MTLTLKPKIFETMIEVYLQKLFATMSNGFYSLAIVTEKTP